MTLGVADLARSRRFYAEGLGWRRGNSGKEIVFFQLGGFILALFPRGELAADAKLPDGGRGFGGVTLAYCTRRREEVDSLLAEAQVAGATILKPAQGVFWGGYSGYFADLDSHPWEIAWNPDWTIADAGETRLR